MIKTGKLLKNNKGSALIMVFAVVLLLVSFGTITLLAGVSNAQMGARYRNWSQEYYEVDQLTENYVAQMDSLLNNAENYARSYFANRAYEDATPDVSKIPVMNGLSNNLRFNFDTDLQRLINQYWSHSVQSTDESQYVTNLKKFIDVGFKKLYYYYAINILDRWSDSLEGSNEVRITLNNINNRIPTTYALISTWEDIPDYNNDNDYLGVGIVATRNDSSIINSSKRVNAQLTVRLPEYQTITQVRKIPIKTNPIWTNAITAAGSIYFDDQPTALSQQVNIYGDLFSADKNVQTDTGTTAELGDSLAESQDNGIVSHGANVRVYGNIYSRGDVHVVKKSTIDYGTRSYGSITVNPYNKTLTPVTLKMSAFRNMPDDNMQNYYLKKLGKNIYNTDIESLIPKYAQDGKIYNALKDKDGKFPYIPFIYPDINGGNVYCNSLTIDEGCNAADITVTGHLTMRDDIQNDGTSSNITLNGNLIGISSESDKYGNPNASSSVTNNEPLSSNITLNGNIIVPGEIYLKFDDYSRKDELILKAPFYYQTGISVGSWGKNNEVYNGFSKKLEGEQDNQFASYYRGTDPAFIFFDGINSENSEKVAHITQYLNSLTSTTSVDTSLTVFNQVEGYVLGTVIAKTSTSSNSSVINVSNVGANSVAFSVLSQNSVLYSIMNAKTLGLGYSTNSKSVKATNSFSDYVNKDALSTNKNNITYYESDGTLALNGTTNGIVYAEGNLRITGNGEFNGTIICEGNVTIEGRPTIRYSEAEIKKCLLANVSLEEFFKPGESGQETYVDETNIDGIYKSSNVMRRYIINQWREEQVQVNNTNESRQ